MLNRIVDIYPDSEVERVSRYPQWLGRMGVKIEYLTLIFYGGDMFAQILNITFEFDQSEKLVSVKSMYFTKQ